MKTTLFIAAAIMLLFTVFSDTSASHMLGGQITATANSSQDYSYQIKVTVYSSRVSEVEFGNFELDLGFGEAIQGYDSFEHIRKIPNEDSLIAIDNFLINHTYPGPGEYLIYVREFNRPFDIVNMQNSVNTPFYMETLLTIDPLSGSNSSPVLTDPLVFDTHVKTRFAHSIGAADLDGDSLSYALVTPKQNMGKYVEGYYFPHRLGIISANPPAQENGIIPALLEFENGHLVWNAPAYGGNYTIAFQVKEWRKIEGEWKEIGYVTRDLTIQVQDTINHTNGSDYITATQDEREPQEVVLFPNPTEGKFEININERWYNSTLTIRDILGRKVFEVPITGQRTAYFDLPHLSTGMYVLLLQKGMHRHSFTFVKQ